MLNEPSHKAMMISFLVRQALLILRLEFDEATGLFYTEALVQEGIDKQIQIWWLHLKVLLLLLL
jgi:hypothetical protein